MIVDKNVTPDRDLYFLGSIVIEILIARKETKIDYFELYNKMNHEHEISINLFTLVLDWLFIVGVIKNAENGMIEKCF
ncbi:MAG: hypothetical protein K0Q79_541 [Flavipsychrobacter sp.]|jgi:hypothetical protein|nr:hypothetical protein [Flavipsychrobacter sp.]